MLIEKTHSGQDGRYGDYFIRFNITTNKSFEDIKEKLFETIKNEYNKDLFNMWTQEEYKIKEKLYFANHFVTYYRINKRYFGFELEIVSPSTH